MMKTADVSRSYPFHSIAKHFGVDYGDVLLLAQHDRKLLSPTPNAHEKQAISKLEAELDHSTLLNLKGVVIHANLEFERMQREGWG